MRSRATRIGLGALALLAFALPSAAQADTLGYCNPASTLFNPLDVPAQGSTQPPTPGVRDEMRVLGGVRTHVLESGPRDSSTAVVFLHGIPSSSYDWVDLLPAVSAATGVRAIAFDLPGFGHSEPTWSTDRSLDGAADYIERALGDLGVSRVHLVVHDLGGAIGLEWGSRHPEALRSVTLIDTGLLLSYKHHSLAQISRPADAGELFWLQMNRLVFSLGIQLGQSLEHQLPAQYVNHMYDDLDRETRCTIIGSYRSAEEAEIQAFARRQAEVFARDPDRPALVLWGANDPYLPVSMAAEQRQGFPSAQVEIFSDAGHWPFIDYPARTRELVVPFLRDAIARDGAPAAAGQPATATGSRARALKKCAKKQSKRARRKCRRRARKLSAE